MVFTLDGKMTNEGSKCELIRMGIPHYLTGDCDQESWHKVHKHLNECDACHKLLFEAVFDEHIVQLH